MWGQELTNQAIKAALRIIPTRVGTSVAAAATAAAATDHPHACGDKSSLK